MRILSGKHTSFGKKPSDSIPKEILNGRCTSQAIQSRRTKDENVTAFYFYLILSSVGLLYLSHTLTVTDVWELRTLGEAVMILPGIPFMVSYSARAVILELLPSYR